MDLVPGRLWGMKRKTTGGGKAGGTKVSTKVSPTAIARKAGVSRQLASRKLQQGKSARVIVLEAQRRREYMAAHGNGNGNGNGKLPTYSESQSTKEYYLSELRRLEVAERSGDLAPVHLLQRYFGDIIAHIKGSVMMWPSQIGQLFGRRVESWLEREVYRAFEEVGRYLRQRAGELGLPDPGPLPTPAPRTPAYYEVYGRDGAVEEVGKEFQIGTHEWHQRHPGVTIQRAFELLAAKKRWDDAMCELLRQRSTWDVDFHVEQAAPEAPTEPPPPGGAAA